MLLCLCSFVFASFGAAAFILCACTLAASEPPGSAMGFEDRGKWGEHPMVPAWSDSINLDE